MLKFLEVHSGLSALLANQTRHDGLWVSSLTHSAIRGLPDNGLASLQDRANLVEEIRMVSDKLIMVDVDNLGPLEHVAHLVKSFEFAGADYIVIEDKKGFKQNSLLEDNPQQLEEVDDFCAKIKEAKEASFHLIVVARIESLIAKRSMIDALLRAEAYVGAGADVILIHSKQKVDASEVLEFAGNFKKLHDAPLAAIPTNYTLPDEHPFDIVIEANQMLRASLKAMKDYVDGKPVELASVEEIFKLCGH